MMLLHPRRRFAALAVVTLVVVTGCSSPTDTPQQPPGDDSGAAGDTTMRVYTVVEARELDIDASVHVSGFLIDDGGGWQLCEAALESYPPQCGGDALTVEGLDAEALPLEREGAVRWQDGATVVGEIDGDVLTVTSATAAS